MWENKCGTWATEWPSGEEAFCSAFRVSTLRLPSVPHRAPTLSHQGQGWRIYLFTYLLINRRNYYINRTKQCSNLAFWLLFISFLFCTYPFLLSFKVKSFWVAMIHLYHTTNPVKKVCIKNVDYTTWLMCDSFYQRLTSLSTPTTIARWTKEMGNFASSCWLVEIRAKSINSHKMGMLVQVVDLIFLC